jgi:hypothetical protein
MSIQRMPFARSVTVARPFEVKALEALKEHYPDYYTLEDYEKGKISAHWLQPEKPKDIERLTIFFRLTSSRFQESWVEAMMIKSKNGPYEWVGDMVGDKDIFIRKNDVFRGFNPLEYYRTTENLVCWELFLLGCFRPLDSTMLTKKPLTQNKSGDIELAAE